jgi:glycosyl-4,4'-diaponeurosporenoate acyltransferase
MLRRVRSWPATAALDLVAIALAHGVTGYLAHRLPPEKLEHDGWLLRPRAVEQQGRAYRRVRIDRWKHRVPEAGALFPGGVSKQALRPGDDGLHELVRETRRAELAHWGALACGPLFALWNPPVPAAALLLYSVGANAPFIAIQRYNRQRAQAVLARRRA